MQDPQTIIIDQYQPPENRWQLTPEQIAQTRELIATYNEDMGGLEQFGELSDYYAKEFIEEEYLLEIQSIAKQCGILEEEVLLSNLYYDAFKVVMGCTAFAIDTNDGPIHARNLDWWTKNNLLCRNTAICHYLPGNGKQEFKTVAWPGYAAALSGMAPGKFSITLNAVLSDEEAKLTKSISFLIRSVLSSAPSYEAAVDILAQQEIVCDCLLLVCGAKTGEMCVIERTPTRHAIRKPENGFIVVANNYKSMDVDLNKEENEIQSTSCSRFSSAMNSVGTLSPENAADSFEILSDARIKMDITVQQMFFSAKHNILKTQLP